MDCYTFIAMPQEKRYEILKYLPTYGPMYISVTDSGEPYYSEGFAVRFLKDDGTDWVANFKTGSGRLNTVAELYGSNNLLIVANGKCYIMNTNETNPIFTFGYGFNELLFIPQIGILLYSENEIEILYNDGTIANNRIYFDGIKDVVVENDIVKGITCDEAGKWIPFEYNISTKELTTIGGMWEYLESNGIAYDTKQHKNNKEKPWWKFW